MNPTGVVEPASPGGGRGVPPTGGGTVPLGVLLLLTLELLGGGALLTLELLTGVAATMIVLIGESQQSPVAGEQLCIRNL